MNLLAQFNEIMNSDIRSRVALYVDETDVKASKAIDGLAYTVLGGLMKRTTSEIGVNQLFNHIQKGRYDGSLTDTLPTILRDPGQTNVLITQGNDVISHLLPAMKSSIGMMISTYAGIRNSSAISLLGLVTTVVLHALGKQAKERKLDADGLAASLFSEREALVNAVPEDLMPRLIEKVGLQQVVAGLAMPARRTITESVGSAGSGGRSVATATRPSVSYDSTDSDDDNGSLGKWGVGALLVVAVMVGGFYLYQNTQRHNTEEVNDVTSVAIDTAQADTVLRSVAVPTEPISRPASVTSSATPVGAATGNLTAQITPYLSNPALPKGRVFPVTGVAFQPGSLSMTPGSLSAMGELTALLKKYPALQVQLIGYANDAQGVGSTNQSLSFKRVNQIKQQLVSSGINFVRIDAIGRGTGVNPRDLSGVARPMRKIDMKVVVK